MYPEIFIEKRIFRRDIAIWRISWSLDSLPTASGFNWVHSTLFFESTWNRCTFEILTIVIRVTLSKCLRVFVALISLFNSKRNKKSLSIFINTQIKFVENTSLTRNLKIKPLLESWKIRIRPVQPRFRLTRTLAGFDVTYAGGWSLWIPFFSIYNILINFWIFIL